MTDPNEEVVGKAVEVKLQDGTLPGLSAGWYRAKVDWVVETGTVVATLTDAGDHTNDQVGVGPGDCRLLTQRSVGGTLEEVLCDAE